MTAAVAFEPPTFLEPRLVTARVDRAARLEAINVALSDQGDDYIIEALRSGVVGAIDLVYAARWWLQNKSRTYMVAEALKNHTSKELELSLISNLVCSTDQDIEPRQRSAGWFVLAQLGHFEPRFLEGRIPKPNEFRGIFDNYVLCVCPHLTERTAVEAGEKFHKENACGNENLVRVLYDRFEKFSAETLERLSTCGHRSFQDAAQYRIAKNTDASDILALIKQEDFFIMRDSPRPIYPDHRREMTRKAMTGLWLLYGPDRISDLLSAAGRFLFKSPVTLDEVAKDFVFPCEEARAGLKQRGRSANTEVAEGAVRRLAEDYPDNDTARYLVEMASVPAFAATALSALLQIPAPLWNNDQTIKAKLAALIPSAGYSMHTVLQCLQRCSIVNAPLAESIYGHLEPLEDGGTWGSAIVEVTLSRLCANVGIAEFREIVARAGEPTTPVLKAFATGLALAQGPEEAVTDRLWQWANAAVASCEPPDLSKDSGFLPLVFCGQLRGFSKLEHAAPPMTVFNHYLGETVLGARSDGYPSGMSESLRLLGYCEVPAVLPCLVQAFHHLGSPLVDFAVSALMRRGVFGFVFREVERFEDQARRNWINKLAQHFFVPVNGSAGSTSDQSRVASLTTMAS
jgi:hypothetical protein